MILVFKFVNTTENGVLERVLLRTLSNSSCSGHLIRRGDDTELYVESESAEELEKFANELALSVPHSIFMKDYSVEAVDSIPDLPAWEDRFPKPDALPPCPKCLLDVENSESKEFGNIFTSCEVCGYSVEPVSVKLTNFAKEIELSADSNHNEIFDSLAKVIYNGGSAVVTTMNGTVTVSALTQKSIEKFPVDEVVTYDVHTASRFFEMQKGEVLALGSIEKPRIRLQTTALFKEKYPFFNTPFFNVKLPDDMVLFLLMRSLKKLGGELFYISKRVDASLPISFTFDLKSSYLKPLEVVVTDSGEAIVSSGERTILTWRGRGFGKKSLSICGDYVGLMKDESIEIVKKEELAGKDMEVDEVLIAESEEAPDTKAPVIRYAHRHSALFSILGQHNLLDKKIAGVYISKSHDSAIMIHSQKFGLVDFIQFDFNYKSFDEIFFGIENMDETGTRLLANFKKSFSERLERLKDCAIKDDGSSIMTLFGVIGAILGFGDDNIESAKRLLSNAEEFKGKKGPRIDYKLKEERNLDPLWSIRTAMSFKLAGVDDLTLSFGVVESFSEFLSSMIDDIETDMGLDGVVLCGSLFEEKKILQKSNMLISKNHSVYFNKALPLDDINVAYGALLLTL